MTRLMGTVSMFLVMLLPQLAPAQAQTTFDLPGAQSAYAEIDDIRMYCETYGKGESLLLISPAYIPYLICQSRRNGNGLRR